MRSPRRRGWRHPKGLDRDVRPNPDVYREGWRLLRNAGIELTDFEPDLRAELAAVNARFLDGFRYSTEAEQRNTADGAPYWIPFAQNNGHFTVKAEKHEFRTRWTACGEKAIYAFDGEHNVALAKNARCFEEIDDPSALPFTNYTLKGQRGRDRCLPRRPARLPSRSSSGGARPQSRRGSGQTRCLVASQGRQAQR